MATHGAVGEFDASQDDWSAYLERLEEYFVANDIPDGSAAMCSIIVRVFLAL